MNKLKIVQNLPRPLLNFFAKNKFLRPLSRKLYESFFSKTNRIVELPHLGKNVLMDINPLYFKGFILGTHEPIVMNVLNTNLKSDMFAIEIGSHIGYFSLYLSNKLKNNGKLILFECSPGVAKLLKRNIELNHFDSFVKIEELAVSDQNSTMDLFITENEEGATHSLIGGLAGKEKKIQIQTTTLDNYFNTNNITKKVDFIKIDAEGAEGIILKGAEEVIKKDKPILLIEMHTIEGSTYKLAEELLKQYGYSYEVFDNEYEDIAYHILCKPIF
jgi:FkbM family methyltransferase